MENEWERITTNTSRLKVFGGWIVRLYSESVEGYTITFILDPSKEWVL